MAPITSTPFPFTRDLTESVHTEYPVHSRSPEIRNPAPAELYQTAPNFKNQQASTPSLLSWAWNKLSSTFAQRTGSAVLQDGSSLPSLKSPTPTFATTEDLIHRAHQAHEAMRGGYLWGTDEARLHHALAGLSPQEVEALAAEYHMRWQRDLFADIKSELSGLDLEVANAHLQGNHPLAEALSLGKLLEGTTISNIPTSELAQKLATLPHDQLFKVREAFHHRFGTSIEHTIENHLSGGTLLDNFAVDSKEALKALATGNRIHGAALLLRGGYFGSGPKKEEMVTLLSTFTPGERQAVLDRFNQIAPEATAEFTKGSTVSDDHALLEAMLTADPARERAVKIHAAINGWFGYSPKDALPLLENLSPQEWRAVGVAFEKEYGINFTDTLLRDASDIEARALAETEQYGSPREVTKIRLAVDGYGSSPEEILALLRTKTKEEIEQLERAYTQEFGESLSERFFGTKGFFGEFYARDRLAIHHAMAGSDVDLNTRLIQAKEKLQLEESGLSHWLSRPFTEADESAHRSTKVLENHLSMKERGDKVTGESLRLHALRAELALREYAKANDVVTEHAATVMTVGGAVGAVAASGGTAAPVVGAVLTGAGGGAAGNVMARQGMAGGAYGLGDMPRDIAVGAVEGSLGGVGTVTEPLQRAHFLWRYGVGGMSAGVGEVAEAGLKGELKGQTAQEIAARAVISGAVGAGAVGVIDGIVGGRRFVGDLVYEKSLPVELRGVFGRARGVRGGLADASQLSRTFSVLRAELGDEELQRLGALSARELQDLIAAAELARVLPEFGWVLADPQMTSRIKADPRMQKYLTASFGENSELLTSALTEKTAERSIREMVDQFSELKSNDSEAFLIPGLINE